MAGISSLLLNNIPLLLLLVGAGLVIAEAFAPGAHFFVVGVALFAAGLVGLALSPLVGVGAINFVIMAAVVLVASLATLFAYRELDIYEGQGKDKTSDSSSLRGKSGRVTERVSPTEGEVKLEGGGFNPYYRARSVDGEIPEGEEVIVVDPGGGNVLTVESFADITDEIDRELERGRSRDRETVEERETETETET